MNINKEINKINKLIINNKHILSAKYKERNDLLEKFLKNGNIKQSDLDEIDEYIENVESENKDLEKRLEEVKKERPRCKYYKSFKGCDKKSNCTFAHSEIDNYENIKEIVNKHLHEDIIYKIIEDNKKKSGDFDIPFNFEVFVDGKEYKFNDNSEINKTECYDIESGTQKEKKIIRNNNSTECIDLISCFYNDINKCTNKIKTSINEKITKEDRKDKIYLNFTLNKITSELLLFKHNFDDIIEEQSRKK